MIKIKALRGIDMGVYSLEIGDTTTYVLSTRALEYLLQNELGIKKLDVDDLVYACMNYDETDFDLDSDGYIKNGTHR